MAEAEPISRRQKIHNTSVTVYHDRFSDLSDSLICHILSYIPTKEAVATSILAKRWKPLWRYTHSIDFDDHKYKNNETRYSRFVHFVNTILFSLDNSHPIKKFHLKSKSTFTSNENMNVWVNFALQHKVEHLEIESGQITTKLPSSIFTCKTIVVMKLHQAKFDDAISSIHLPSLKTLHLCDVFFSSSWCLVELLSNCELLENLVINNIITQTHTGFVYMGISLSVNLLTTIDLPKLISAEVYFSNHWVVLTALSKAKFLLFDLKKCYHRDVRIPIFQNLAHLELRFDVDYDWNYLAKILQNSPNLQILVLKKKTNSKTNNNQHFFVGQFISPHLRKCYIGGFEGTECEMQFARYVMKNATALSTFTISSYSSSNLDKKFQMLQKLSTFPRLSATCELYFE